MLKSWFFVRKITNFHELYQLSFHCYENWSNIHPELCPKLVDGYQKCLIKVQLFKVFIPKFAGVLVYL